MSGNGAGAEGAGYAQFTPPDPFAALWLVVPGPPPLAPPSQGWERRASQTQKEWRHRRHPGAIWAPSGRHLGAITRIPERLGRHDAIFQLFFVRVPSLAYSGESAKSFADE